MGKSLVAGWSERHCIWLANEWVGEKNKKNLFGQD